MTRALLLALWMLPSAVSAAENTPADVIAQQGVGIALKEGNRLYEEGRFDQAVGWYQTALKAEPNSATIHYNLGNAYFRLGLPGSLGRSIASYYRAFQISPRDGDIRHNYDFALKSAGET